MEGIQEKFSFNMHRSFTVRWGIMGKSLLYHSYLAIKSKVQGNMAGTGNIATSKCPLETLSICDNTHGMVPGSNAI